jgi:NADH dehydrogenase [ubiquinone] 1 alpha subcomplex assembly factor 1
MTLLLPFVIFDFSDPAAVHAWHAIDDRVMGGVSRSRLRADPAGHAVFEGAVSLDRGGGFASVRSTSGDRSAPGAMVCRIEVRGDPRQFKLGLLTDDGFDGVHYQAEFTPADAWRTLVLPLADFSPRFRGRVIPDAPALEPARIRQVGLMIAGRQAGPFTLAIRRIELA